MARPDPHSVFDDTQPRLRHLDWRARFDFDARIIAAEARLTFDGAGDVVDLDTRDLTIERVTGRDGARLDYELGAPHPFLGQRLRIARPPALVHIRYRTSPSAMALHWSNQSPQWSNQSPPGSTSSVYSQCQPIHARTLVPLPDSPSSRIRYRATLTAPRALTALMAARFVARRDGTDEADTTYEMVEPIPPYLLAFAVGDYVERELSPRVRVWAPPAFADAAARDLGDVERWIGEAEQLLGPYPWPRFDLLIAPPSFPHGGMENPQLAFLSPTLLGDAALWPVIAHELAHAWSGNLVTAASAEHFWLNEAFTVWIERRIVAAIAGEDVARAHERAGRRELAGAVTAFADMPERTRLRLSLDAVDPDEGLSIVAYEKGYLLLRAIEEALGYERFVAFVRAWLTRFAWQAVSTEQFRAFALEWLPQHPYDEWFDQSGIPKGLDSDGDSTAAASQPALPENWLNQLRYGRLKLIRPIYLALCRQPERRAEAAELYRRFRDGYHPVARQQLERLFREQGVAIDTVKPLGLGRRQP